MRNLIAEILEKELNIDIRYGSGFTISSPFRRDSNPSFRVYPPDNRSKYGSAYDFGTGEVFTPINFIMKLYNISYREAIEFINIHYGITIKDNIEHKDNNIQGMIKFTAKSINEFDLEAGICQYIKHNNNSILHKYIPNKIAL